jgi:hypothetical protein
MDAGDVVVDERWIGMRRASQAGNLYYPVSLRWADAGYGSIA